MNRIYNEHVRLDQSEEDELIRMTKIMNCSKSEVLRRLLKYKIVYASPPVEYGKLIAELRRIGTNMNQIARSLNANGFANTADLKQAISDLYSFENDLDRKLCAKCEVLI